MRLEVGAVDHQSLGRPSLGGQGREDVVEHAHAAPADEAVVQGLVRAVSGERRVRRRAGSAGRLAAALSQPLQACLYRVAGQ